ncbi:MAG: peroxiredoxin [Thermoplasmata archaeon]
MLAVGDAAPDFDAATHGGRLRLSSLRGKRVVLYFYPKAGTYGCTRESTEFARAYPTFQERGTEVVGVSVDTTNDLQGFAESCHLPFPLVSDSERTISRQYGVLGAFGYARRVTFLLAPDGRIEEVISTPLPGPHVRRALEMVARPAP